MINLFKILPFLLFLLSVTSASAASTSLFNGKDLAGWKIPSGNEKAGWYQAKQGVLELRSGPKKKGSVLWTEKNYKDFEVDLEFRFVDGTIDSGIHLRNSDQIQIGISGSLKRDMTCSPYIPGKGYPVEASDVAMGSSGLELKRAMMVTATTLMHVSIPVLLLRVVMALFSLVLRPATMATLMMVITAVLIARRLLRYVGMVWLS